MTLAHDGQAGFAAVLKQQPDVVLCDVSMPVMSGFELLDRLVELTPRFASLPFIFLTALGDRDNLLKGRRLGAEDYIVKPIELARPGFPSRHPGEPRANDGCGELGIE